MMRQVFCLFICLILLVSALHAGSGPSASTRLSAGPLIDLLKQNARVPGPTGLYGLEQEITFNILDRVAFDPKTKQITLMGHRDDRYLGRRIPYLQHLAAFLEHPRPQFTLNWTPESEARVDALFRQIDSFQGYRDTIQTLLGKFREESGTLTPAGRFILSLLGIKPTLTGGPSGYLGVEAGINPDGSVVITRVYPGSPAELSGLRVGDEIQYIEANGKPQPPVLTPLEFTRIVKFAGAGTTLRISIARGDDYSGVSAALSQGKGDPWDNLDRYDILEVVFRSAGKKQVADIVHAYGVIKRFDKPYEQGVPNAKQALETVVQNLYTVSVVPEHSTLGELQQALDYRESVYAQARSGRITYPEANRRIWDAIFSGMERAFGLSSGSVSGVFDQTFVQGGSFGKALNAGLARVNELTLPMATDTLRNLLQEKLHARDELQLTPDILESQLGIRPEVIPEYQGVDQRSQLARVMFEADYLGKNLLNLPELREKIPAYETEFAFERSHPGAPKPEGAESTLHLWISIDRVDLAQSPDGRVLATRGAKMRFNLRQKGPGGRDLPPARGSYEELLTSLYGDLAVQFPVLHELEESAKLAAVAHWLKAKDPKFSLPREGRVSWHSPDRVPGALFLIWSSHPKPGVPNVAVKAAGGVSLVVPKVPPVGPSGPINAWTVMPKAPDHALISKIVHRKFEVPEWHPVGWVTPATKGGKTLGKISEAVSLFPDASGCNVENALELGQKLSNARRLAGMLKDVESAINLINRQNPNWQAELAHLEEDLEEQKRESWETVFHSLEILTFGAMEQAHKGGLLEHLGRPGAFLGQMQEQQIPDAAATAYKTAKELRESHNPEQVLDALSEFFQAAVKMSAPETAAGSLLSKSLYYGKKALDTAEAAYLALKTFQGYHALLHGRGKLKKLTPEMGQELARLKNELLPLQRKLSDQLSAALSDPLVKSWMDGNVQNCR